MNVTAARRVDFTQGSIVRGIVMFSLPIVMGELLQNLYNSVDALVVGNLVSDSALAAVGVCGVISNLLVNFFNGVSVGSSVVVSRAFGKGDTDEVRRSVQAVFTFSALLGVALSVLGILLAPQLLRLTGALPEYYADALVYLRIYLAGLMFTVIYNNAAGILRAVGNSQTPFYLLAVSCVTNIVLDIVLVALFRLGVAGVGAATVFSQLLSAILVYRAVNRSIGVRCLDVWEMRHSARIVVSALSVGMAAGVQSALIAFSNLFVVRYMNLFDTASVAGIGIAQRLDKFIILPAKSFGITMTTYVGQNLGAGHYERVREGVKKCAAVALSVTAALSVLVYALSEQCVRLFNQTPEVVAVGVAMMHVLIPFFWCMALREVLLGVLRGYGRSLVPMMLSLTGMVAIRQLYLAISMRSGQNIRNIYICYPLAWVATLLLLFVYYLLARKNLPGCTRKN